MAKKTNIRIILLFAILILVFLLSVKVTARYSRVYLDGDTSADMLLAHELYKSGDIMSKDWYYGSEPRIIYNQLVFIPLFHFTSNWSSVRIIGIMILQIIMVLSFSFMMKKANMKTEQILLGSILLLLPFNNLYAQFVLYQAYYITYVSYGFVITGLLFSFVNAWDDMKNYKKWVYFSLLLLISFVTALQGYRPIVTLIIPLFLIVILRIFLLESKNKANFSVISFFCKYRNWLIPSTGMLLMGVAGALTYVFYIRKEYSCMDYASLETGFITIENLWQVLLNIFRQFGYREKVSISSLFGLLSVASVYTAGYSMISGFRSLFDDSEGNEINPTSVLNGMMVVGFVTVIIVNILTNSNMNDRYMIPPAVWMIPLICTFFDADFSSLSIKKLLNYGCLLVFIGNALLNSAINLERPEVSDLSRKASESFVKRLENSIDFLVENDYTYGIADHWQASVITELTNGALPVSSITWYNSGLRWFNTLTPESFRHLPEGKTFLMVGTAAVEWYQTLDVPFEAYIVYQDQNFTIFDIPDLDSLRDYLDNNRNDGNPRITWSVGKS